ncbi:MAG: hypothetical protein JEZ11_26405 [Desulfobacterales bacterium]|nr:hypothetical protein [Desulfobacterales bacterium]
MNRRRTPTIADPASPEGLRLRLKGFAAQNAGQARKSLLAVDLTANKFASLREGFDGF